MNIKVINEKDDRKVKKYYKKRRVVLNPVEIVSASGKKGVILEIDPFEDSIDIDLEKGIVIEILDSKTRRFKL